MWGGSVQHHTPTASLGIFFKNAVSDKIKKALGAKNDQEKLAFDPVWVFIRLGTTPRVWYRVNIKIPICGLGSFSLKQVQNGWSFKFHCKI